MRFQFLSSLVTQTLHYSTRKNQKADNNEAYASKDTAFIYVVALIVTLDLPYKQLQAGCLRDVTKSYDYRRALHSCHSVFLPAYRVAKTKEYEFHLQTFIPHKVDSANECRPVSVIAEYQIERYSLLRTSNCCNDPNPLDLGGLQSSQL